MQKELQTAYQRWEMASFGDDRPSTVAAARRAAEEAPPPVPMPTEQELAAIREAARAEGFAQGRAAGHAEGLANGRTEAAGELQRLRGIADAYGQAVARADDTIANDVLDLALHLARGMVRTAFEVRPDMIIPIVREAIGYLPVLQQPAMLMLNPQDVPLVRAGMGDELEKAGWRVIEDAQVARGGCKVDTASNQIDAQAATRWARLAHALGKNVEWLDT
jgi:flagellar assembly protein FliH